MQELGKYKRCGVKKILKGENIINYNIFSNFFLYLPFTSICLSLSICFFFSFPHVLILSNLHLSPLSLCLSSAHAPVGGLHRFQHLIHVHTRWYYAFRADTLFRLLCSTRLWNGTSLLSFTPTSGMRDGDQHDSEQPRDQSRSSPRAAAAVRATEAGGGSPAAPVRRAGGGVRALLQ